MAERVRYDAATSKWFREHLRQETTVMRCSACGLYYKPVLGHKCKAERSDGK